MYACPGPIIIIIIITTNTQQDFFHPMSLIIFYCASSPCRLQIVYINLVLYFISSHTYTRAVPQSAYASKLGKPEKEWAQYMFILNILSGHIARPTFTSCKQSILHRVLHSCFPSMTLGQQNKRGRVKRAPSTLILPTCIVVIAPIRVWKL